MLPFSSQWKSPATHSSAVGSGRLSLDQTAIIESSLYAASRVLAGSALSVRFEGRNLFLESGAARLVLLVGFGVTANVF